MYISVPAASHLSKTEKALAKEKKTVEKIILKIQAIILAFQSHVLLHVSQWNETAKLLNLHQLHFFVG